MVYETAENVNSYEGNKHEKVKFWDVYCIYSGMVYWCMHSSPVWCAGIVLLV